jgi:uncharacterized membrane protein YcaP (DUF421 family)
MISYINYFIINQKKFASAIIFNAKRFQIFNILIIFITLFFFFFFFEKMYKKFNKYRKFNPMQYTLR